VKNCVCVHCRTLLRLSSCLVVLSCLATGQNLSPAQIYAEYSSSIVLIKTDVSGGTGFVVSPMA
jgi:hypothetical protein